MEELKYLIENVLPSMQTGGAWILGYFFAKLVFVFSGWMMFIFAVYKLFANLIQLMRFGDQVQQIRDYLKIGHEGTYTNREHDQVMIKIMELMKNNGA